jgi:CBS domain-containing protein
MTTRDIMRRDPIAIRDSDTLGEAERLMKRFGVRHLPVVIEDKLVGMLSDRDVLAARSRPRWWLAAASDAMQLAPQTAHPDDSLVELAARMAASKVDAFPVVERGKLVGIVSVIDVLDADVRRAMTAPADAPIGVLGARPPTVRPDQPLLDAVTVMYDHHVRDVAVVDKSGKLVGMLAEQHVRRALGDPAQYCESTSSRVFDVEDVMDPRVASVAADRPISELAHYFVDNRVDAVPVVDPTGTVVGVVSYLDALHALAK